VISLSQRAAEEIRAALAEKGIAGYGLRVQVVGGGCEGFLYDLLFTDQPDPADCIFASSGIDVFVDRRALAAVDGLTIDYSTTRYGEGFVFLNPRARSQCSCGASFSA